MAGSGGSGRKIGRRLIGGNWDNGFLGGLFTFNVNNAPSNVNTNIGFRLASMQLPEDGRLTGRPALMLLEPPSFLSEVNSNMSAPGW